MSNFIKSFPHFFNLEKRSNYYLLFSLFASISFLLGILSSYKSPVIGIALCVALFSCFYIFNNIKLALIIVVIAQFCIPVYIRLPIPGFSVLPPPLFLLLILTMIVGFRILMSKQINFNLFDDRGLTLCMGLHAFMQLLTIHNNLTNKDTMGMWIKAIAIPILFYLLILYIVDNINDIKKLFKIFLFTGACISLFAIIESRLEQNILIENFLLGTPFAKDTLYRKASERASAQEYRVFGTFDNVLEYGPLMAMIYPFGLLGFLSSKTAKTKALYAVCTLIIVFGVLTTLSRGPLLSLAISSTIISFFYKELRKYLALGLVFMIIMVVALKPEIFTVMNKRLKDSRNVSIRFLLWETALHVYKENPIIGVGIGNHRNVMYDTINEYRVGPFLDYEQKTVDHVKTTDNMYLQILSESGTLGMICFLIMIAKFYETAIRIYRNSSGQLKLLTFACCVGATNYLLTAMTVTNYTLYTITMMMYGFFFGIMGVLLRIHKNNNEDTHLKVAS